QEQLEEATLQLVTVKRNLESATAEATRRESENGRLRAELSRSQAETSRLQIALEDRKRAFDDLRVTSEACLASISGRTRHAMELEAERNVVWQSDGYHSTGGPMRFRLISTVGRHPQGWGVITYKAWSNHGRIALQLTATPRTGAPLQLRLPDVE